MLGKTAWYTNLGKYRYFFVSFNLLIIFFFIVILSYILDILLSSSSVFYILILLTKLWSLFVEVY